jgi:hypothetical protein
VAGHHRQATWKVRVDTRHNRVAAQINGIGAWYVGNLKLSVNSGSIGTFYSWLEDGWIGDYGVVSKDVTRVAVALNNHQKLNLYPVTAAGRRWVGLQVPPGIRAVTLTAYSGNHQIAHAVNLAGPVTWLLPGQHGLAKQHVTVAGVVPPAGSNKIRWSLEVQAGPWGYCLSLAGFHGHNGFFADDCMSPDTAKSAGVKVIMRSVPRKLARWLVGTAKPSVAYLKFDLAGGGTRRAEAVLVEGQRFFVLPLRPATEVKSWAAYDKAGHKLYGGTGSPQIDRYTGPLSAIGWADNVPCSLSAEACHYRAHGSA